MEFTTEKSKVGILPLISFMFRAKIEFIRLGKLILDNVVTSFVHRTLCCLYRGETI